MRTNGSKFRPSDAVAQLPAVDGYFTAAAHGSWDDKDVNTEVGYTASVYGQYLQNQGCKTEQPFWLYTCGAGAFDQGAASMVSIFNVAVVASNGYVQMPCADLTKFFSAGNPLSPTSSYFPLFPQWLTFKPSDDSINFMPSNPSDVTHVVH